MKRDVNKLDRSARRVVVMGPPGAGKSAVARAIGSALGIPAYHLDQFFFRPGWAEVPREQFTADVERLAALPAWVIDGNFTFAIEARLRSADTVIYLDVPSWLCVTRVVRRTWRGYGRSRPDMAEGCPEKFSLGFLWFTLNWNRTSRTRNLAIIEGFPGRRIVLRGRVAARRFLGGPTL